MDIKNIKVLAKILNDSGLSAVEICEGDQKIRLEKNLTAQVMPYAMPTPPSLPQDPVIAAINDKPGDGALDFNNIIEVKSPMIGVFYASPSPDSPPFVKIGQKVNKGDTLCIIEAMKMMNEIPAETSGEIVDICVSNGQLVEYSQVLFKIF